MNKYTIKLNKTNSFDVELFTYNEKRANEVDGDWKLTHIKSKANQLMPMTDKIKVFAPDDIEIIDANEYGIFLGHKGDK